MPVVCQRCQATVPEDEAREHAGRLLCEDCYMETLSPARTCDPWAVYTASRLPEKVLTPLQERLLAVIDRQGPLAPEALARELGLAPAELGREIATLRHLELVRGSLAPDGTKLIRRFADRD